MEGKKVWRSALALLVGAMILLVSAGPAQALYIYGVPPPVTDPGPPTDPPPPGGEGETPPEDPPIDPPPPPDATPEPASIVTALVGAGLAGAYGWRRRRRYNPATEQA